MEGTEFEGLPLPTRMRAYTQILATGWATWIGHMVPEIFGSMYTPKQQADIMLSALAIGAGRWARNPAAKPPRALSMKRLIQQFEERRGDERDFVMLDMIDSLAGCAQGACADIGSHLKYEGDIRTMIVPLQLSGMRAGAAYAFAPLFPAAATLETLDALLRENAPADVGWWELDRMN